MAIRTVVRTTKRSLLLSLAVALFLSTIIVVCDYHDAPRSKICPICFVRGSLSSAIGEATFVARVVSSEPFYLGAATNEKSLPGQACARGISYRGPPLSSFPDSL